MAQEDDAVTAYMAALKGSAQPAAAAAASARESALERDSTPPGAAQKTYQGVEKRSSARYRCEGSVELQEAGCDVSTWAKFTDISLHGCYVEAQATYPVGTSLHMKLGINSHKIETPGTVRVNYPYAGMGIAFGDMNEESRSQLKHLVTTILRPVMVIGPGIASSPSAPGSMEPAPVISDPAAAIQSLIRFFENKQMLTRDDFLRVLRESQKSHTES